MSEGTAIGILGSAGRMCRAIAGVAAEMDVRVVGGTEAGDDPLPLARKADVLVDFSAPAALAANLAAATAAGTPIVVGTTGLGPEHHQALEDAATRVAVLQTGNTSLGVTLLAVLVGEAAARLGPDWDIEIAEFHHRHKVDAPSGTALLLGEAAATARGRPLSELRAERTGKRAAGSIGFAAMRGGSVVGDHQVVFAGEGERIELSHRAEDRAIFARGALKAALWLAGRAAGRYRMRDVLGL